MKKHFFLIVVLVFVLFGGLEAIDLDPDMQGLAGKTVLVETTRDGNGCYYLGVVVKGDKSIIQLRPGTEKLHQKYLKKKKKKGWNIFAATDGQTFEFKNPEKNVVIYIVESVKKEIPAFNFRLWQKDKEEALKKAEEEKKRLEEERKKQEAERKKKEEEARQKELIEKLQELKGKQIIIKALRKDMGITHYYGEVKDVGTSRATVVIRENYKEKWMSKYMERNYTRTQTFAFDKTMYLRSDYFPAFYSLYIVEKGKEPVLFYDNPNKRPREINKKKAERREISYNACHIKGWRKNDVGRWVYNSSDSIPSFRARENDSIQGGKSDEMGWLKARDFTHDGKDYTVILKIGVHFAGYKYKYIKRGAKYRSSIAYWIFAKSELEKLKNLEEGKANIVKIKLTASYFRHGEDEDVEEWIENYPDQFKKSKLNPGTLYLNIRPFKEKDKAQFMLFVRKKSGAVTGFHSSQPFLPVSTLTSAKLYNYAYYEVPFDDFRYFLPIDTK